MEQLFNFDLDKISNYSEKEALDRKKNLKLFLNTGFPNKKDENWKFTDLNSIISKIEDNTLLTLKSHSQKKNLQIRYSVKDDFTDIVVKEYMMKKINLIKLLLTL